MFYFTCALSFPCLLSALCGGADSHPHLQRHTVNRLHRHNHIFSSANKMLKIPTRAPNSFFQTHTRSHSLISVAHASEMLTLSIPAWVLQFGTERQDIF